LASRESAVWTRLDGGGMSTTHHTYRVVSIVIVVGLAAALAGQTSVRAAANLSAGCRPAGRLLAATPPSAVSTRRIASTSVPRIASHPYDWPLKPFDRQHPVRAFLDDPRGPHGGVAFHFGIDIAAPDGTPVYAVEAGTVYFDNPLAIAVVAPDHTHAFGYWHIVPRVHSHQFVERHQLLGVIVRGEGHVHFAESWGKHYVNPLRRGALTPYVDRTPPTVASILLTHGPRGSTVVVDAFDTTTPRVPGRWAHEPVSAAVLQWRITRSGQRAPKWHAGVDFGVDFLPLSRYHSVYSSGTEQNKKGKPGRYCLIVARGLNLGKLPPASYRLQVRASDTRGNSAELGLPFTIAHQIER
jgi:Peptidase family M23